MQFPESRNAQYTSSVSAVASLKQNQEELYCYKEFYIMSLMLLNVCIDVYTK